MRMRMRLRMRMRMRIKMGMGMGMRMRTTTKNHWQNKYKTKSFCLTFIFCNYLTEFFLNCFVTQSGRFFQDFLKITFSPRYRFVCLSVCLFVCLSVCLSVFLSVCLSVCLSVRFFCCCLRIVFFSPYIYVDLPQTVQQIERDIYLNAICFMTIILPNIDR